MRKLGINSGYLRGVTEIDSLKYMKEAGFDSFFSGPSCCDLQRAWDLKNEATKLGLDFEFIHVPFTYKGVHVNTYWDPGLGYQTLFDSVIAGIDNAAAVGVDMIVHHVSGGWIAPPITDMGFSRFDAVVEHSLNKGVRVAFENLRNVGNLAAILERYARIPEVGFCYDCGHEHCYTVDVPFLDLFGKRTMCTHLHDNWGLDKEDPLKDADYHLIPFDGDFDYHTMIERMDKYNYQGSLMLECGQNPKYQDMGPEEFSALIFERAKRIRES